VADSGQLCWDATNNRLGLGIVAPSSILDISQNDAILKIGDSSSNAGTGPRIQITSKFGATDTSAFLGYSYYNNKTYLQHGRGDAGGIELRSANGTARLYMQNSNGNIGIGTGTPGSALDVVGGGNFTGSVTVSGDITATNLVSSNSAGSEGGEIRLTKAASGTTLNGTTINIDIFNNQLRIFEGGSPNRGYFLDMTEGGASAATPLRQKSWCYFTPLDNQPPASGFATLDTRNSIAVLDFDHVAEESAVFVGVVPDNAVVSSGISVRIL
jgi:hypothetical protein